LGIKPLAFRVSHGIKAEMGFIPSPINDRVYDEIYIVGCVYLVPSQPPLRAECRSRPGIEFIRQLGLVDITERLKGLRQIAGNDLDEIYIH
jgi:hypothetical protein